MCQLEQQQDWPSHDASGLAVQASMLEGAAADQYSHGPREKGYTLHSHALVAVVKEGDGSIQPDSWAVMHKATVDTAVVAENKDPLVEHFAEVREYRERKEDLSMLSKPAQGGLPMSSPVSATVDSAAMEALEHWKRPEDCTEEARTWKGCCPAGVPASAEEVDEAEHCASVEPEKAWDARSSIAATSAAVAGVESFDAAVEQVAVENPAH